MARQYASQCPNGNNREQCPGWRSGADTLLSGAGNDTYLVDTAGDVAERRTRMRAWTRCRAQSHVHPHCECNLTLAGNAAINGTVMP